MESEYCNLALKKCHLKPFECGICGRDCEANPNFTGRNEFFSERWIERPDDGGLPKTAFKFFKTNQICFVCANSIGYYLRRWMMKVQGITERKLMKSYWKKNCFEIEEKQVKWACLEALVDHFFSHAVRTRGMEL